MADSLDPLRALRARAESQAAAGQAGPAPARPVADLLHELQVHQIELEMQNEELRRAQQALEESRDRYVDLYDFAPVGYLTLSRDATIVEINLTGAAMLGVERRKLVHSRFAPFVALADRDTWHRLFMAVIHQDERREGELELRRADASTFQARIDCVPMIGDVDQPAVRAVLIDISERRRLELERAEHMRRIEELSHHLVAVQEGERRRLSEELHARTSPNLAALQINMGTLVANLPSPLSETVDYLLADIGALLEDTTASIREISADLRAPVLDHAGLLPALEGYVMHFMGRTGMAVEVVTEGLEERLPAETESLLFRIVQEGLTNCAKHSKATMVRVALVCSGGHIELTITDDGVGFDPAAPARDRRAMGLGLLSMRERAEFAGGTFRLTSRPGVGTQIRIEIGAAASA